jgi:hypothetical protein
MPIRSPPRATNEVSTPCERSTETAPSPNGFAGSRVTKRASSPKLAKETATLASPPP